MCPKKIEKMKFSLLQISTKAMFNIFIGFIDTVQSHSDTYHFYDIKV